MEPASPSSELINFMEEEEDADAKEEIKNASPTKEEVKSPGSSFEFMNNND